MHVNEHTLSTLSIGHVDSIEVHVTPLDVARFAELSGDHSPLHVDADFARSRGFGGCVAHGMLIGAHVSALIGNRLPGKNGIMKGCELVFRSALVPPETLTITGEVTGISEGTGQLTIKVTVTNKAGDVLSTGQVKSIVRIPSPTP